MSTEESRMPMIGRARFDKLLEPYHIGKVPTRNRIVKTAAGTRYTHNDDIHLSDTVKAFYEALARGGVGLLMVESPAIDFPLGVTNIRRFRIDDDKFIPLLSELTQVIHKHGCPTFLQLYHSGPWHKTQLFGLQPVAASAIDMSSALDRPKDMPRELTIPEIEQLVDKFASAAERAQKAGFDGVEVNASSSHLIASFLSRFWNRRQDAYGGGSLESRARFLLEIIRETKKRLGPDFPVTVLINGVEVGGEDESLNYAEGQALARMIQEAGADALHVRFHWRALDLASMHPESLFYPEPLIPLKSFPKELDWSHKGTGATLPVAAAIKRAVSIPVITAGRLDAELGEEALRQGKVDFIGLCRRLMADPELPNKLASGRLDDIAPCLACKECMRAYNQAVRCRVNAALGTEQQYVIKQAGKKKRVLVVGGGPAGMEAARVAALRGHEVMLYEREPKLGGLLPMAAVVKGLEIEDLPALVRYLKRQITKLGVKIRLGKEVNPSLIEEIKPDAVILAAGGIPALPDIPGINGRNVVNGTQLHHSLRNYLRFLGPRVLRWLTKLWMPLGKRVVIIGGDIQGCELAEFLVKRGRKVTIVATAEEMGEGLVDNTKTRLLWWLSERGVSMMTGVRYEEITDKGLTVITKEGKRQTIAADTIVPAIPLNPNNELLKSLEGKVPEIHAIGDCMEPGLIIDAIADGSRIAHTI
jgi:2,4-dienoyl-CoA reductase (NADPH2)